MTVRIGKWARRAALAAASTWAVGSSLSLGQIFTWINASGGTFSVAGNWSPAGPPSTTAHTAVFSLANAYTVTLTNSPSIGSMNLSAGTVTFAGGAQTLSLTGQANVTGGATTFSGGTLSVGSDLIVNTGARLTFQGGGDLIALRLLLGQNLGDGSLTITGAGSTARFISTSPSLLGQNGLKGTLSFNGGAVGTFTSIGLADSSVANSGGTFSVLSGSLVAASGNLDLAPNGFTGQTALLQVSGTGSSFLQTGAGTIALGAAANSAGTISVGAGATFSTGTGTLAINPTGTVTIAAGGTFLANGTVQVAGGRLLAPSTAFFSLAPNQRLQISNGGQATFGPSVVASNGSTWSNTAGTLTAGGLQVATNGTPGTVSFNGASAVGSIAGSTSIGLGGGVGLVEVLGGGSVEFQALDVADSTNSATRGTFNLGAGSTITFSGMAIAAQSVGGAIGTMTVAGRAIAAAGSTVTIGSSTATGSALLQVNSGGTFGAPDAGTIQVNATGRVFVNGGILEAGTHVNVAGGQLDFSTSTSLLDLADGANGTLTVSNGGTLTTGALLVADSDRYLIVDSTLSVGTNLVVGSGSFGVLSVSGAAARVTGGNLSVQGFATSTFLDSEFRIQNAAIGTLGNIGLSASTSNPVVSIATGARLTAGNLSVSGTSTGFATFTISGGTSEFTQTGGSTVTIGNSSLSPNTFASISGGTWTAGTGTFLINPSGRLSVGGTGTVRSGGPLRIDTGAITMTVNSQLDVAGSLEVVNEGSISLAGNARVLVGGTALFDSDATLTINGPNAAMRIAGALNASIFTSIDVQDGLLEFAGADYGGATTGAGLFFFTSSPTQIATVQINGGSFNGFSNGSFYNLYNAGTGTLGMNRLNLVNGASMTLSGTLSIGRDAAAELNVLSGSDVSSNLLAGPFDGTGSASILVEGPGSTVTATDLRLGLPGNPSVLASARVRNGGSISVNGSAVLFGGAELVVDPGGTLFLGDAAAVGTAFATSTGTLRINGGTLSLSSPAAVLPHAGPFEFPGGTIALRSASTLDAVTQARLLGPARTLGPGQAMSVAGVASLTGGSAQPLTIDGGLLAVGTLANTAGGLVVRSGTLSMSSPLVVGSVFPLGGNAYVGPNAAISVANTGSIAAASRLTLERSSLVATTIVNAGDLRLLDDARISAGNLTNTGTLSGVGQIAAIVTNSAGGRIRLTPLDQLTTNLISNNGSIDLLGGRLHATGNLNNNNTGAIVGWGNLQVDGTINNLGTITFTGGTADVQASLTNNPGGRVTVTGGSHTTVYETVANITGSQFRVAEASVVAFLGNVVGLGAFTGPGTKIFEAGASGGPLVSELGRTIVETTGDLDAARIREARLEVYGDAAITPSASSLSPPVSRVSSLFIAGGTGAYTGRVDLANTALVIDYSGASVLPEVNDQVLVGFAGGAWTGNGIRSSAAAATPGTAIGLAEAADLGLATFLGEPVDSTAVLLRFTRLGDANLDGTTNIGDFALLAANFNQPGRWSRGDFNYDGTVGIGDFALLAANFNRSLPAETARAMIPEPAGLAAAVAAVLGGLLRRRRTNDFS